MSYIRATQSPDWEEGIGEGLYVYSSSNHIVGLPQKERLFIGVVMRMLDQSDVLDDETLEEAHGALRQRLNIEKGTLGKNG